MLRLLIDSGVCMKWFVLEPDAALAFPIYNALLANQLEVAVPDLVYAEFGNIL